MKKLLIILFVSFFANANSMKILQEKCFDGCKKSCQLVVDFYSDKNQNENALYFNKILCAKQVPNACKNISDAYLNKDIKLSKFYQDKALLYAKKGCAKNIGDGCFWAGVYTNDSSFYAKAMKNYTKECQNDDFDSCYFLADMYLHKNAKDYKQVISLYNKACENDHFASCYALGGLYKDGIYVKKDLKQSSKFFKKACKLNPNFCE